MFSHVHLFRTQVSNSEDGGVQVECTVGGRPAQFCASRLLFATGRTPNTAGLAGPALHLDAGGHVRVDANLQTSLPNVFAAGDVIGGDMFVYTAAEEGAIAASNAVDKSGGKCLDRHQVPWVVFTDPQVAGVGVSQQQAAAAGLAVDVSTVPLSMVPRCIAARNTAGLVTLIRDHSTHKILGARVVAPEGGELATAASIAISAGLTSEQLAAMLFPYLTLSEALKLAALGFDQDLHSLSCCAAT